MLNGIKSIRYYTAVGAAAGAFVGIGASSLAVLPICGEEAARTIFLSKFMGAGSDLERGAAAFQSCAIMLPFAGAAIGAMCGGVLGLTYGVAKEIFSNYTITARKLN